MAMKNISITSPKGVLVRFTHLNNPDEFSGSRQYKCELALDPSDPKVAEFLEKIDTAAKMTFEEGVAELKEKGGKFVKQAKELVLTTPVDEEYDEAGEETGRMIVKMKANAEYKKGDQVVEAKLSYYDAKAKPIKGQPPLIYSGSTVRISGALVPYVATGLKKAGVSFRIYSVQIIELRTGGQGDNGFEAEDDGYEYEEAAVAEVSDEPQGFDDADDF